MKATMWTFCDRLALIGLVWAGIHTGNTWARERLVEEFHQAYPLATNGEIRVENVNGRAGAPRRARRTRRTILGRPAGSAGR